MRIVVRALRPAAHAPATVIPGQGLVDHHSTAGDLADKAMYTLFEIRLVPMVVIQVFTQHPVVRSHIPFQCGVVGSRRMLNNALGRDFFPRFVAVVFGHEKYAHVWFPNHIAISLSSSCPVQKPCHCFTNNRFASPLLSFESFTP